LDHPSRPSDSQQITPLQPKNSKTYGTYIESRPAIVFGCKRHVSAAPGVLGLRVLELLDDMLTDDGLGRRDVILAQHSFYSGARMVPHYMVYLLEHGNYDKLHDTIHRQNRPIRRIVVRKHRKH
jgi:hypothetical protein